MNTESDPIPQLPISCLAEMVDRGGRSPESILRRFKFKDDAEGHVRTIYHPTARATIRSYFAADKDRQIIDRWIDACAKKAEATSKKAVRARHINNGKAVSAFIGHFGERGLTVFKEKLIIDIEGITFAASPDLIEQTHGDLRLVKIGFGNKSQTFIDTVLVVMWKAALLRDIAVQQNNVVYLCSSRGIEIRSRISYEEMVMTLAEAALKISAIWPRVRRAHNRASLGGMNRPHAIGLPGQAEGF